MGCCSAKRKAHINDDSCYVCENLKPYDHNIYTLKLLKCIPKYPKMNEFSNKPYYNPSGIQKDLYRNLNFNDSCQCGCLGTGYQRFDSVKCIESHECTSTDEESEEMKPAIIMPKSKIQVCPSKRYKLESSSEEVSTVSYECKSSDSYLSFTCQCIRSKPHESYKSMGDIVKEHNVQKDIGIQKESEKCCAVREQYDDYIKNMEKSWYCCYKVLHEIKELLSEMDESDNKKFPPKQCPFDDRKTPPNDSPIHSGKKYPLPYTTIPVYSGLLKNDSEEAEIEEHLPPKLSLFDDRKTPPNDPTIDSGKAHSNDSTIDSGKAHSNDSQIDNGKELALPYTPIPVYSGLYKNDSKESESEEHFRPTNI